MIAVACATDERYAPHCATMLRSLLSHAPPGRVHVHVLHDASLPADSRARLEQVAHAGGARLSWLEVTPEVIAGFPAERFHVSCWYRVLLPQLLALDRVLYLDSDLLVLKDPQELWEFDLQGRLFAAAVNPLYPFMPPRWQALGLGSPAEYLNSGVMLMDLAQMRREKLPQRLRDYGKAHPDHPWPEQDALSAVCRGRWRALPPRWNAQTTLFDLRPAQLPLDAAEAAVARRNPAIVHFIGPLKPWHYLSRHPLRHLYAQYRRETPWPELELEGRTAGNALLRPFSFATQLRLRRLAAPAIPLYHKAVWWARQARLRGPRLMRAFARHYADAVFVQIGSNDGVKHDPLRASFRRSNWRGVMVEPVPYVFSRLQRRYGDDPRVRLERVAVASTPGTLPFYHLAEAAPGETVPDWYDGLGSFDQNVVLGHQDRIPDIARRMVAIEVPCVTFAELCHRNQIDSLDLLHVDTEGHDYEILKSVDFARHRPVLLIYEHKHLGAARAEARARMEALGYRIFEEKADTWCIDARPRDERHRRLLADWERHTA